MRKKLSISLILIGTIIFMIPIAGNLYNAYQRNKLMREWAHSDYISQDIESDRVKNYESLADLFAEDNEPKDKNYRPNMIGTIEISKIGVDIPILNGATKEDLKWGAGHLKGTAPLGSEGNTALAGHRSYTFGKIFNRLNEVERGDEIIIRTKDDSFHYKVYDIKVVEPTDFSVLDPKGDRKILTLITCDPIFIASHRLIVHAEMVESNK